jgi:hypothetical protein
MNGEKKDIPPGTPTLTQVERIFEQSSSAISFYCDMTQVVSTGNEVVLQLYETIPAPPDREGKITKVISRLKATVTFSLPHALNFGKVIVERTSGEKHESH